jgi:hypothetical protein
MSGETPGGVVPTGESPEEGRTEINPAGATATDHDGRTPSNLSNVDFTR